jgi:hypothetical protein
MEVTMMNHRNRVVGITAALTLVAAMVPAVRAGTAVDPDSLNPPPPPGASCEQTGPSTVICHTAISFPLEGEPRFDIGCGTVYETSTDDRFGIRWYTDGNLVKRIFRGALDGTWSLSPDAGGPVIEITGNWSVAGYLTVPGDLDTVVQTEHGLMVHGTAKGLGASLILAGRIEDEDGALNGVNRVDEPIGEISAAAIATIESVLCP